MGEQLHCGAARACITPPEQLMPKLVGLKHSRFAGVIDDIFVRVVALSAGERRALIIAYDMTNTPCSECLLEAISARSGAGVENILFFAIHTHAVPACSVDLERRELLPDEVLRASQAYTAFLEERTFQAVDAAVAALRPARMGLGYGESHINVNRNQDYQAVGEDGEIFTVVGLGANPDGPADKALAAVRFDGVDGEPIAFLLNYAVHNVATIWNDFDGSGAMGISSDVGGNVSQELERAFAGSVAVWSSGAAGDVNPIMLNEVIYPDPRTGLPTPYMPKGGETALVALRILANRHFADALRVVRAIECRTAAVEIAGTVDWSRTPGCECVRRPDRDPEYRTGAGVPEHTVRLNALRVGELILFGVSGELYASLGEVARRASPMRNTLVVTHNARPLANGHYLMDDETMERIRMSRGKALVPGYDEFRHLPNYLSADFERLSREMIGRLL